MKRMLHDIVAQLPTATHTETVSVKFKIICSIHHGVVILRITFKSRIYRDCGVAVGFSNFQDNEIVS